MSEYSDNGNDIKLDILQRELDKIVQKREITEQLSERVRKGISFYDAYGTLMLSVGLVLGLFITIIILAW